MNVWHVALLPRCFAVVRGTHALWVVIGMPSAWAGWKEIQGGNNDAAGPGGARVRRGSSWMSRREHKQIDEMQMCHFSCLFFPSPELHQLDRRTYCFALRERCCIGHVWVPRAENSAAGRSQIKTVVVFLLMHSGIHNSQSANLSFHCWLQIQIYLFITHFIQYFFIIFYQNWFIAPLKSAYVESLSRAQCFCSN